MKKLLHLITVVWVVFMYAQTSLTPNLADWKIYPTSVNVSPADALVLSSLSSGTDYASSYALAANSNLEIVVKLPVLTNGGMFLYAVESDITGVVVETYESTDALTWTTLNLANYNNGRGDDLQKADIPQSSSNKYFKVILKNTSTVSKNLKDFSLYKFNSTGKNQYFVFIGASLTEPTGSLAEWKSSIQSNLSTAYQPVVFNWALSGYNTEQLLAKIDEFLSKHPQAGYVFVETAGNDITSLRPLTYDRTQESIHTTLFSNMKLLITKAKSYGKVVIPSRISFRNYTASTSWRGYAQPAVNAGLNQEYGSLPYNFYMDQIIKDECPDFYNSDEKRGYLDFYQLTLNNQSILSDGTHIYGSEQYKIRNFWIDYGFKYIYQGTRSSVIPYTEVVSNIVSLATNAVVLAESTPTGANVFNAKILVEQIADKNTRIALYNRLDNVALAPFITSQPINKEVTVGQTASFSVAAGGLSPLSYQWYKNSVLISGATTSTYTFTPLLGDNGSVYYCKISNSLGTLNSGTATLTVISAPAAPTITTQPVATSVVAGNAATFMVGVSGTAPFTYQWQKNSVDIPGAISSQYSFVTTSADNSTTYRCLVSNANGAVYSSSATLTVTAASSWVCKIVPYTYTSAAPYDAGFNTAQYESYAYQKTQGWTVQKLPFRILKPVNYDANPTKKYPVIIMYHGKGEKGIDNNFHLKWGGLEHLNAVNNKTFDGFVVFPQEPYGYWTTSPNYSAGFGQCSDALKLAFEMTDSLLLKYRIDPNKVYAHGLSSGGTAVWASIYNRPDLYAAVCPMSTPGDLTQIEKISTTPIWLFQGREDDNPRPWVSRPIVAALRQAGQLDSKWAKYSEYPGVYHSAWINAYIDPDFYPFMLRQNRNDLKILGLNPIPTGGTTSLGVLAGMYMYEWYKDGVLVSGEGAHRLDNIKSAGVYYARFKAKPSDVAWITTNTVTLTLSALNNAPPVVAVVSPTPYITNTFSPYTVKFYAAAFDPNGSISKVEFYNGSTLLNSDATAPYEYEWSGMAAGTYDVVTKATDNLGATTAITTRIYVGSVSNTYPSVDLSSPGYNASYAANSNVLVGATATDTDGGVVKVDFYLNNFFVGSDATAPYEYTLTGLAAGTYSVLAKAIDVRGAVSSTSSRTFTITAAANVLPVVNLTAPITNAIYTAPASVTLQATASDADGSVAKVEFYNGTTLLYSDATAPYEYIWSNVNTGTYALSAKVTDNSGAIVTSSVSNITVNPAPNVLPQVSLLSPLSGAVYIAPAIVLLSANATDSDGSISKVEFYNGATLIGSVSSAPFQINWSGISAGSYAITAKATDNSGAISSSTVSVIQVNENQAPTVTLNMVSSENPIIAPAVVNFSVLAVDVDGTVAYVEFYEGSTLKSTDYTSPYSLDLSNVLSGNYTYSAKVYDNLGLSSFSNVVTLNVIPNQLPTVTVTSPASSTIFTSPALITISATAADADGSVASVEFYNGTTLLGTDTESPYTMNWTGVQAGTYSISAKVFDNKGGFSQSDAVAIVVQPSPNILPTVSLTSPVTGASYVAPATISLSASASDADGSIKKVEFYNGTQLLAIDSLAPYGYNWNNVSVGNYSLTAKAFDNALESTVSSPINIVVNANQAPTVSLTAPISGTSLTAPASVTISASASDIDGTIASLEFYNGSVFLGTDNTAPYTITVTNLSAGTYSFSAKAIDNLGASSISTTSSVTVTPSLSPVTSTLTAPSVGTVFAVGSNVNLAASASSTAGAITKVEFYNGSTLLGTDTYAPFTSTIWNAGSATYYLTAKAYDAAGNTATSTIVVFYVNYASTSYFVNNASCLSASSSPTFELNADLKTNATAYSWTYSGSGVSISPVAGANYKAIITTNSSLTSGDLCVGVNYSVAPTYKKYCKTLAVCTSTARLGLDEDALSLSVDYTNNEFELTTLKAVKYLKIHNLSGQMVEQLTGSQLNNFKFGADYLLGIYLVSVTYEDETVDHIKILKQ